MRAILGLCILNGFLFSLSASANVGETFGFGSKNASLSGATLAAKMNGFSAYSNPASLTVPPSNQRFAFEYGFIYMVPQFTPISGILLQSSGFTLDSNQTGDMDLGSNEYRATFGQTLGASFNITQTPVPITLGVATFLPLNQTMYMDSGLLYLPEYVLYRSRTQRPQLDAAVGVDMGQGFHLGVGFHLGFVLTANADTTLQNDPTKTSTMRFLSSLKPIAAPYFGFLYQYGNFSAGTVVRLPVSSNVDMTARSRARVTTLPAAFLDFYFNATSALQYDPLTVEFGTSFQTTSFWTTYLQLEFQNWSAFQIPALNVKNTDTSGIVITNSVVPAYAFQNIWVPRIGNEFIIGSSRIRLGYSYHSSILNGGTPSGLGNYIDPPKHTFSAGYGLELKNFLGLNHPSYLDLHFSYHHLVSGHITKSTSTDIGSPGYDIGGKILGGGLSLSFLM